MYSIHNIQISSVLAFLMRDSCSNQSKKSEEECWQTNISVNVLHGGFKRYPHPFIRFKMNWINISLLQTGTLLYLWSVYHPVSVPVLEFRWKLLHNGEHINNVRPIKDFLLHSALKDWFRSQKLVTVMRPNSSQMISFKHTHTHTCMYSGGTLLMGELTDWHVSVTTPVSSLQWTALGNS